MPFRLTKKNLEIFYPEEKLAFKVPDEITVSEWADKYRILDSMTSAEPGHWRTHRTPYLKGIMDAFNNPHIEEITIMAATQLGKTESMYNMIGYIIDQDPGPTLLVMPRVPDAKSVSYNRIKPMIESSPVLNSHLPELADDMTKLEYHLDRMILYFAGSNSPADLAQRPIRYVFFDEIDKYPRFSGKEADPIKLGTERTRTFWNRKIVKVSTPTIRQGYIYREYEKSDRQKYFAPCPHCNKYQILLWSQIKWPEGERDPEKIKNEKLAWYECEYCKCKITDIDKQRIMAKGVWAPEESGFNQPGDIQVDENHSRHRGFWLSSLYSPWLTWSDIAAEFLGSKDHIELLMNFINSWLAEPWEEKTEETIPEKLKELSGGYPEGQLPEGVLVLTAGVDVQKDHFYIVIRGWGIGEESWLIRTCRVESWEEVLSILFKTNYPNAKRTDPLGVRLACIDTGYRTDEVYDVCRRYRDIARPIKGQDHLPGAPYRISPLDKNPRTGTTIPGGLTLWHLDTSHYKDKVNRMVHAGPGDPSKWHLFEGISEEYLKQFCAEHKIILRDKKGRAHEEWQKITSGRPNHYWDVEIYAAAAADMIRVSALRSEDDKYIYYPRPVAVQAEKEKKGSWLNRDSKGWMHGR
jgi:phage terminase large subunit GpA-like protein